MIKLNAITGYSASSRKSKDTLEGFIDDVLISTIPAGILDKNVEFSVKRKCIKDSFKFLKRGDGNVLLIGKSMGGVRTYWMLVKYWDELMEIVGDNKLGVILIDPHGWQRGDRRFGSYGVRLDLKYQEKWDRDNVQIHLLRQSNKYPKGAAMEVPVGRHLWFEDTKLGKDATHWNVTEHGTPTGRIVGDAIIDMVDWLELKKLS